MKLRYLSPAATVALIAATTSADPRDLLFHAGFEGTVQAEKAIGSNEPIKALASRSFVSGVRGQGVQLKTGGIHYLREDNLNVPAGTVALWMRPDEWDPERKTKNYEWTFGACGTGPEGDRIQFFKMPNPLLMVMVGREGHVHSLTRSTRGWRRGQWRFFAFTWDRRAVKLYIDGSPVARTALNPDHLPIDTGPVVRLQAAEATTFDELRIFGRPLLEAEVRELYQRDRPTVADAAPAASASYPSTVIPKVTHPPTMDGALSPKEWEQRTLISGFLEIPDLEVTSRRTHVRLCYDDQALYAALTSPVGDAQEPPAAVVRDGNVWQAPSAELLLTCGDGPDLPVHQLVTNLHDQHFDQLNGDRSWNPRWRSCSSVADEQWICEIEIPFSELSATPALGQTWRLNMGRNFMEPRKFANPIVALAYADKAAFWRVRFGEPRDQVRLDLHIDPAKRAFSFGGTVGQGKASGAKLTVELKRSEQPVRPRRSIADFPRVAGKPILSRTCPVSAAAGEVNVTGNLPQPGEYLLRARLYAADGSPLYQQLFPFRLTEFFSTILAFRSRDREAWVEWELNTPIQGPFHVTSELRDTDDRVLLRSMEQVERRTHGRLRFDVSHLKGLDYRIRTTLKAEAGSFARDDPFTCYLNAEWIGFERRMAARHAVPKPWKAIKVHDGKILTLTQKYELGRDGLPTKARAGGVELLARPMRLQFATTKSSFSPEGDVEWREKHDDVVHFQQSYRATDASAALDVRVEFDGMMRYDLTVRPGGADTRLAALVLEIPIRGDVARLKYPYRSTYQKWDVMDLPAEVAGTYADAFMPHIWVGDDTSGLAWFAESDEHYEVAQNGRVVELVCGQGGATVLRINMVNVPRPVRRPLTYTFGLQATPSRPMAMDNWTAYRFASCIATPRKHVTCGYSTGNEYHVKTGVPYPAMDPERAKRYVRQTHRHAEMHAIVYATSNGMGGNAPEFRFFEQEWKNPLACDTWTFASRGFYHWGTCPTSESLRDFFLWSTDQAIDEYGIDGLYYDYGTVFRTDNPAAGCGYARDGARLPTWPIFGDREMRKRIYQLFMEKRGHATFVLHNYSKMVTPIATFMTLHLDGESYQRRTGGVGAKLTDDYTRLLTIPRVRAMFGTQFGTVPCFLPKLATCREDYGTPWLKRATRTMIALLLPHGVPIWGFYCDIPELNRYITAQDRFGIENSRFVPYYDRQNRLKLVPPGPPERVLVSYWEKPGELLVVLGNLSDDAYKGQLRLPSGIPAEVDDLSAVEVVLNLPLQPARGAIPVEMPPKDYRLIRLRPAR